MKTFTVIIFLIAGVIFGTKMYQHEAYISQLEIFYATQEKILFAKNSSVEVRYLAFRRLAVSKDLKYASKWAEYWVQVNSEAYLPIAIPFLLKTRPKPSKSFLRTAIFHKQKDVRIKSLIALTQKQLSFTVPLLEKSLTRQGLQTEEKKLIERSLNYQLK